MSWKQYVEREIASAEYTIELGRGDSMSVANREEEDGKRIMELLQEIRDALADDV